jgi:hypothetical protein
MQKIFPIGNASVILFRAKALPTLSSTFESVAGIVSKENNSNSGWRSLDRWLCISLCQPEMSVSPDTLSFKSVSRFDFSPAWAIGWLPDERNRSRVALTWNSSHRPRSGTAWDYYRLLLCGLNQTDFVNCWKLSNSTVVCSPREVNSCYGGA